VKSIIAVIAVKGILVLLVVADFCYFVLKDQFVLSSVISAQPVCTKQQIK